MLARRLNRALVGRTNEMPSLRAGEPRRNPRRRHAGAELRRRGRARARARRPPLDVRRRARGGDAVLARGGDPRARARGLPRGRRALPPPARIAAALRLAERGYAVKLYEQKPMLGGGLASRPGAGDVKLDVYPHMYLSWYRNFGRCWRTRAAAGAPASSRCRPSSSCRP